MPLAALTTENMVGLGVVAGAFIVFALVCSLVIPHFRPAFPSRKAMTIFLVASVGFFVAMLMAIEIFGVEKEEAEAAETTEIVETTPAGTTTVEEAPPVDPALVAKGEELYTSLGCVGCHSLDGAAGVGPTFQGLAGSEVTLTDGTPVLADDAYLAESITAPDAAVSEGFAPGVMSAAIKPGSVSDEDVQALVAFVNAQK